jgi:prepilin-type N-terminal cleavage/methylation domain-containing protein
MFIAPNKATLRRSFWSAAIPRWRDRFKSADIHLRQGYGGQVSAQSKACGFTLLEIMLAVTILGMMSLAIYRFVQSNMIAMQLSAGTAAEDAQYDGLRDLLTAQWQSLSPLRANMIGEPFKLGDRERDKIKWSCGAGPALLTRYAAGDFNVTLLLQPASEKGDRLDLGFLRKPQKGSGGGEPQESWVPLIANVTSLEIAYFDPGANNWLPRWPGGRLPSLIRITVGRTYSALPWEAVIPLRRTPYF